MENNIKLRMEDNIKLRDVLDALKNAHRAGAVDDVRKLTQIANRWLTKTQLEKKQLHQKRNKRVP